MAIYYRVREASDLGAMATGFVVRGSEGEANRAAQAAANKHHKPFSVYRCHETQYGTYRPGGVANASSRFPNYQSYRDAIALLLRRCMPAFDITKEGTDARIAWTSAIRENVLSPFGVKLFAEIPEPRWEEAYTALLRYFSEEGKDGEETAE